MKEILGNNLEQFFFLYQITQKNMEQYVHTKVIDMKFG